MSAEDIAVLLWAVIFSLPMVAFIGPGIYDEIQRRRKRGGDRR